MSRPILTKDEVRETLKEAAKEAIVDEFKMLFNNEVTHDAEAPRHFGNGMKAILQSLADSFADVENEDMLK